MRRFWGQIRNKGKARKIPVPEFPFPFVNRELILLFGHTLVKRSDVRGVRAYRDLVPIAGEDQLPVYEMRLWLHNSSVMSAP
jgi:hypothetical protein